jgi:hypothetical protein
MNNNLIVIEKYEEFVNYIYPILQNIQRKHGVVKEKMIQIIFNQIELFYKAVKTNHISKIYEADSNLATIRFYLRFLADKNRKLISQKQLQVASVKLAEVGRIIHSWICKYSKG